MASTYKDIQRLTKLSLSTISKYFNGGNVLDENRKAIERAIVKLDFRVNEYARGLKSKRSKTIGVLIPELNSTFHTAIIAEVEDILRQHGYGTIVCDSRLDKKVERDSLEFLLGKMVDGIITIPFDKSGEHLLLADERNVPVVLIDRLETDYKTDAVIVDNSGAAEMAVNEFAENGHTKIAILCGPEGVFTMKARMDGFRRALAKHRIEPNDDYFVSEKMTISGGYEGAKRLLKMEDPPSALFCANYEMTLGAIIAVNESGIKVPSELSLIGIDNLTLAQVVKPTLTIISQPMREIAENAARLMLNRLEDPQKGRKEIIELNVSMVRGQSVLCLPKF
ncbi:MAG TPA: LacI family DNA-binding transcriptional regulator [Caproiciproducens sp.]|nr:LacI family DNA-binding transcriptional regulator [Caproiciproducens sp.]